MLTSKKCVFVLHKEFDMDLGWGHCPCQEEFDMDLGWGHCPCLAFHQIV